MPPTRGISCLSLVLYGIRIGSEGHHSDYNIWRPGYTYQQACRLEEREAKVWDSVTTLSWMSLSEDLIFLSRVRVTISMWYLYNIKKYIKSYKSHALSRRRKSLISLYIYIYFVKMNIKLLFLYSYNYGKDWIPLNQFPPLCKLKWQNYY